MRIAYVTIGRNVGTEPMNDSEWKGFKDDTREALAATIGEPAFVIDGTGGEWDGIAEESAVFTILEPWTDQAHQLRTHLAILADAYRQDAIALALGESELVGAGALIPA